MHLQDKIHADARLLRGDKNSIEEKGGKSPERTFYQITKIQI